MRILFVAVLLSSCATTYTGNEYYYTEGTTSWTCREPAPYEGGNCKPEGEWEE